MNGQVTGKGWKRVESQSKTTPKRPHVESRRRSRTRKSRRKIQIICALAVTAAIIASATFYAVQNNYLDSIQAAVDILPDRNAASGVLNAGDGEPVSQGDYWIILNQLPTLTNGSRECNIQFENPKENHYSSRLNLYLKSTGERIGGTRRVDTGNYVEIIQLNQTLAPGEYPILAVVELFTGTDPAGEMTLEIKLRVLEENR